MDKVIIVKQPDDAIMNMVGMIGEIVCEVNRDHVGVKFDIVDNVKLHTIRGILPTRSGWNVSSNCFIRLGEDCDCSEFEPAHEGDICDMSGEPADYRAGNLKFSKKYAICVRKCSICGEWHYLTDLHSHEDGVFGWLCMKCIERFEYRICEDCGRYTDHVFTVNLGMEDEHEVCRTCLTDTRRYFVCTDCNEVYSRNYLAESDSYGEAICERCISQWATCYDCGRLVRRVNSNLHNDEYWCDEHNPARRAVHDYGYKPAPVFYKNDDETSGTNLYLGVELEIDGGINRNATASSLNSDRVYCKRDGSLSTSGIEIVTHPCTLKYHTDNFGWKTIINKARKNRYQSHQIGTCGLHVHVNKSFFGEDEVDICTAKLLIIFQQYWDEIVRFSRRGEYELNRWAGKAEYEFYPSDSPRNVCSKVYDEYNDGNRYKAVNIQNYHTIEFRVFRGTLKYNTLAATLQFVDGMCRLVKRVSLESLFAMSWKTFVSQPEFDHEEFKAYLVERRLIEEAA